MKNHVTNILALLSLASVQLFTIPASQAATIDDAPLIGRDAQLRAGTFAGARIRLAMGSQKKEPKLRAGFTFTAMQSGRSAHGASFARFGEGLEFGITDRNAAPHMSIAGYSLAPKRLGAAEGAEEGSKKGHGSTLRTVAFVAGGFLLAGGIYFGLQIREGIRNSD